jgi:transcriptional regulator with XRE-family HTH domain
MPELSLPDRLRAVRDALGWRQSDVAGRLGLSKQAVSSWERGQSAPSYVQLKRLLDGEGISPDWVLTGSGTMRPAPPEPPPALGNDLHDGGPVYIGGHYVFAAVFDPDGNALFGWRPDGQIVGENTVRLTSRPSALPVS